MRGSAERTTVPWNKGGIQPLDQLRTPSTGCPPGSVSTTYAGRLWLSDPRPYVTHEPSAGRPGCDLPVFMNQIDGSCPLMSVCIERISVTSSTMLAKCGSNSDTSIPHWPCFWNFQGLPNSFLLARSTKLNVTSPA